jgi:di/tripeptidase
MHSHISKVLEWGFTPEHDFKVVRWGCVLCDIETEKPFLYEDISIDHTQCDEDCFGCKARNLQLNTGDATRDIPDKKWNSELKAYRDAKAQGMQPAGTRMKDIEAAYTASEVLNKPYNAEKMPKTKDITKKTVEVMKEIGQI